MVEHFLGKEEVMGSSPISSSVLSKAPLGHAPEATTKQSTRMVGGDVAKEGSWFNLCLLVGKNLTA